MARKNPRDWPWRRLVAVGLGIAAVTALSIIGAVTSVKWCDKKLRAALARPSPGIPLSRLPGPPRATRAGVFRLGETNAARMTGTDDPLNERWCDVSGNYYGTAFVSGFSYEDVADGPRVFVRVQPVAYTLVGRLEARGLKPNFAYQLKLRGLYEHLESFEAIGYAGRWRLPGRATNYRDADYLVHPYKDEVEAYLLFDFFVTDAYGSAVRDFALDSSLHVLWNASRQRQPARPQDLVPVVVQSGDPLVYARAKDDISVELIWAERERRRYVPGQETIGLPTGHYRAELVLTEESFHARDNDGGWWATVARCPVEFTVVEEPESD